MRSLRVAFLPRYRGNPYQTQLEVHLSRLGVDVGDFGRTVISTLTGLARHRPNVVHLHWLDAFFAASNTPAALAKLTVFIGGIMVLRLMGRRIVWTVHNLKDHESRNPKLDRFCTAFVVKHADAIIAHCPAARRALINEFGPSATGKIRVVPHGHYCDTYESSISRAEARRALGVADEALMLLFFGQIRPYKGVLDLIDAFGSLARSDVELVLAGKPSDDEASEVIRVRSARHPRITYRPGFVADDQVQVYMNACDAVVLPYRDILTSGAVVLAMSFGRACVVPRMGCIGDTLDDRGAVFYEPNDADGLVNALKRAIERKRDLPAMGEHNRRLIAPWGWDRIAKMTLDVYQPRSDCKVKSSSGVQDDAG